ncbi:alpha-1,2-mannosyltransferase [Streptoalloteichus hindustanus]|uniref:Alpha-1,2-mannosyltransferase n=1 Tax=Streptoalloteichus hindustanus TaxID=2017 RepID=A0A1M4TSQ5_STRHI|nr:alpha-1,2-mannosyltransferase [Streptoalloteichus hindustanus]
MARARLLASAPWVLGLSVAIHLVVTGCPPVSSLIDLRVYREAAPEVLTGGLYDFRLVDPGDASFPLPFTYTPFAALLFLPLSALPWPVVVGLWQASSLLCLWLLVHSALSLVDSVDPGTRRSAALLWTSAALWLEPVRTTLNYGQVNLFLAASVWTALTRRGAALPGAAVGLAAAVKLTPAVAGLCLVATRRWHAAAWSLATFAATVALGWLAAPEESRRFWFQLLGDAGRVGPVGSAINQSLRGALSRSLGADVGWSLPWWGAVLAVGALAAVAARAALRRDDPVAVVLAVQLFGLLASPVSWSHHWVWVVPALVWLTSAPTRSAVRGAGPVAGAWLLASAGYVVSWLLVAQPSIWEIPRPWPLSALGWAYPACAVLTLVVMATTRRGDRHRARAAEGTTGVRRGAAGPSSDSSPPVSEGPAGGASPS